MFSDWAKTLHHRCDKCQTVHAGTTHWALPISHHFSLTVSYFKVTAMFNSFNWKFCVLIHLSWNFVELLGKSSTEVDNKYIPLFFTFARIQGRQLTHFWFDTNIISGFLSDTIHDIGLSVSNFAWLRPCLESSNSYLTWWPWLYIQVTHMSES